jgi:hypothetical protein
MRPIATSSGPPAPRSRSWRTTRAHATARRAAVATIAATLGGRRANPLTYRQPEARWRLSIGAACAVAFPVAAAVAVIIAGAGAAVT